MNQEEEVYQNAISYEDELVEQPNERWVLPQDESFDDFGFATMTETQGGEYVRSPDNDEEQYEHEQQAFHQPYYEEYNTEDEQWDDLRGWQHHDDYW